MSLDADANPHTPDAQSGFECPYRGLAPFSVQYSRFFFGRKREASQIAAGAITDRCLVLFGPSGVGKSSIIGAALPQALEAIVPGTLMVVFDAWQEGHYRTLLATAKEAAALANDDSVTSLEQLAQTFTRTQRRPIVFVFDQFEQYFVNAPTSERERADRNALEVDLARTANVPDLDAHILIGIREDALHELEKLRDRLPGALRDPIRLEHLDVVAAESAIREPLKVFRELYGVDAGPAEIEDELVRTLLDKARRPTMPSQFETPYLQLALERLWNEEREAKSTVIRLGTYDRLDGWEGIAHRHVGHILDVLDESDQALCARLFDRMVTPSGMKIAMPVDDLADFAGLPATEPDRIERVERVLQTLGTQDSRIVRRIPAKDDQHTAQFEIFHDVLAQPILAWKQAFEAERERRRLHEEAAAERRRQQAEIDEQKRQAARQRVIARSFIALSLALVVVFVVTVLVVHKGAVARAKVIAQRADFAMNFGDHRTALLLALEALPEEPRLDNWLFRPETDEAKTVLSRVLLRPIGSTLSAHDAPINRVAFSPTDDLILTASDDARARLWTKGDAGWTPRLEFKHHDAVTSAKFSADGTLVVTGARNGWTYLWAVDSGEKLAEWSVNERRGRTIADVGPAVGPGGTRRIATVTSGEPARIWRWQPKAHGQGGTPSKPSEIGTLQANTDKANTGATNFVAFDRRGQRVVTTTWRGFAQVWNSETLALIKELKRAEPDPRKYSICEPESANHCDAVVYADFDPADNNRLVTASLDKTARVWSLKSSPEPPEGQEALATLRGHTRAVTHVSFTPGGNRILTASLDGTARLWDANSGRMLQVLPGPGTVSGPAASAAVSPSEHELVVSFSNKWARVWRIPEPLAVSSIERVERRQFSASGLGITVHDPGDSGETDTTSYLDQGPLSIGVHPSGHEIVVAAGPCVERLSIDADRTSDVLSNFASLRHSDGKMFDDGKACRAGDGSLVLSVAFDPAGRRLVTAAQDGTAKIWDVASGRPLARPLRHTGGRSNAVFTAVFSRDGDRLLTAAFEGTVRLWNAETGDEIRSRRITVGAPALAASFGNDSQTVYVLTLDMDHAGSDRTPCFGTAEIEADLISGQAGPVGAARCAVDALGPNITLGGGRDPDDISQELASYPVSRSQIDQVVFSPAGRRLITVSRDGTIDTWRWPPGDTFALVELGRKTVKKDLYGNAQRLSDEERELTGLSDSRMGAFVQQMFSHTLVQLAVAVDQFGDTFKRTLHAGR